MAIDGDEYVGTGEAARRMGVSRQTVLAWIKAGRLPALRNPGGRYRIHKDDAVLERVAPPK